MKFFVDTADIKAISELNEMGMVDGVTTNPSLIMKSGRDIIEVTKEICSIVKGPVSAEVVGTEAEIMIAEGKKLAKIAPNIAVKVPLTWAGLKTCKTLTEEGHMVNVTLCFSANQALLAAKAGATFISPFIGRLDDVNIDGMDLFIVELDSTSPNGYLKRELPQCGTRNNMAFKPHIPRTTIDVKIWLDHNSCCPDTKDYQVCKDIACAPAEDGNGITKVIDPWTNQQIGYNYKVTGTTFKATCDNKPNSQPCGSSSNSRRRRLLQDEYGNSGERL